MWFGAKPIVAEEWVIDPLHLYTGLIGHARTLPIPFRIYLAAPAGPEMQVGVIIRHTDHSILSVTFTVWMSSLHYNFWYPLIYLCMRCSISGYNDCGVPLILLDHEQTIKYLCLHIYVTLANLSSDSQCRLILAYILLSVLSFLDLLQTGHFHWPRI